MEEPIIIEKRDYTKIRKTFLAGVCLILIGFAAWYTWSVLQPNSFFTNLTNNTSDSESGLETTSLEQPRLTGSIIFDEYRRANNDVSTRRAMRYSLEDNTVSPLFEERSIFSVKPESAFTGVGLAFSTDFQIDYPIRYNVQTDAYDVFGSFEGYIAFSADQVESTTGERWSFGSSYAAVSTSSTNVADIQNWIVHLKDSNATDSTIIESATSPVYMNSTNSFLYLKADGIYQFDPITSEEERLFESRSLLTGDSQIAVSARERFLVLTLPSIRAYVAFDLTLEPDELLINQIRFVESDEYIFSSPVFAPAGEVFAMTRESVDPAQSINHYIYFDTVFENIYTIEPMPITSAQNLPPKLTDWVEVL